MPSSESDVNGDESPTTDSVSLLADFLEKLEICCNVNGLAEKGK